MDVIKNYFPYRFTPEQDQAVEDIRQDLSSGEQMQRLLQGETGSGKTAIMFYACIGCALQGKRSIIFAPTVVLAEQHFNNLKNMGWDDIQLYISGCEDNGATITIGTHAVIYDDKLLKSVSLICVDEFQRTGVEQRATLTKYNPHILLVSATPLPRTMMLSVFGDLEISTIHRQPVKRGHIIVKWVLPEKINGVYEILRNELAKGKQAYIIYPLIGTEEQEQSAIGGFEFISNKFFDYKVALLTGKSKNKIEEMQKFRHGDTDIIVSTILAEVGLDNKNATVAIVNGADRFGLSQLWQIRGRICRAESTAFLFLLAETANQTSIDRLEIIEKVQTGFLVAEYDLRLRGPGEMFSTRQHGLPDLKFASLLYDYDLLVKARELAKEYIDKLDEPANAGLKEMLSIKYGDTIKLGETA